MDRVIVVEVLGRGGRVAERVRLAQLPASIGRGVGNDVVVDDRYADAAHARLALDDTGRIVVEDLGSVNGLVAGEHGPPERRLVLAPGATFRVGHTLLRVATTDMAVPQAIRDQGASSRWRRLAYGRAAAPLLTLVGAPLFGLSLYLGQIDKSGGAEFALDALGAMAVVLLWAGAWALGTRVRLGQARFLAHVAVAWLVFGAALLFGIVEEWTRFLAAGSWTAGAVAGVGGFAIVAIVLYGHLAIATRLARGHRLAAAAGVAVLLLALGLVAEVGHRQGHEDDITIDMPLKPVPAGLVPARSADAFLERAARLQQKVDREADQDR